MFRKILLVLFVLLVGFLIGFMPAFYLKSLSSVPIAFKEGFATGEPARKKRISEQLKIIVQVSGEKAEVLASVGRIYFDLGMFSEAENYLEKALKKDPDNIALIEAWIVEARLLYARGKYQKALEKLAQANRRLTNAGGKVYSVAFGMMMNVLLMDQGVSLQDNLGEEEVLLKAEENSNDPGIYLRAAQIYVNKGD